MTAVTLTRRGTLEARLAVVTRADVDAVNLREARRTVALLRERFGFVRRHAPLLTAPDGNAKVSRNERPTWSLFLAPARSSGIVNVCPWSTAQCRATCLATAGRAQMDPRIALARKWRTELAANHSAEFLALLVYELDRVIARGGAVRLNGTSDVRYERVPVIAPYLSLEAFAYDYTKAPRQERAGAGSLALTYSASERWTTSAIVDAVRNGERVAVVLAGMPPKGEPLAESWHGVPLVDGDISDYRPDDGPAVIALRPKGAAKGLPVGGFVRSYRGGAS